MNKLTRFLFALWLIVAGSLGSPEPCLADSVVTLKGTTEVHRMAVKLSDVFTGVPDEIDRDIAQAPAPGKSVTYDINVLQRLAKKYRLDWDAQSITDHVVITTACTRITADMIRDAVIAKIKTGGTKADNVDVSFDSHNMEVDLPAEQNNDFTLNNFDFDTVAKRFRADLVAETSGGPYVVPIAGRLTIKRNIPVLARRLEGGSTIGESDIDFASVPEDRINTSVITDARDLVGHELRRDTDEGELMHTHDVIPPRHVTRGGLITLKIETPYMLLTAQGKALQDGAAGDVVRVINTQSNRMIEGTVAGPGVVVIPIAQKVAEAQ